MSSSHHYKNRGYYDQPKDRKEVVPKKQKTLSERLDHHS
jgi:hypothetical protein